MIRMAYVIEKFPSLTEHFILNEILELEKTNFNIYILALKKSRQSIKTPELGLLKNHVIYLPHFAIYFLLVNFIKHYRENLKIIRNNCNNPSFNIRLLLKQIRHIIIALYLKKRIEKLCITHIHAHFAFITTDIAYIISKLLKLNYSFTAHAQDIFLNKENIVRKIENASFVITCTKYNQSYLNQLTSNKYVNKIYHIYHGIDLNNKLAAMPHANIFYDKTIHILSVARLVEKKGIIYLLKVIKIFINKGIKVKCTIIGEGPQRKELINYIISEKILNYVEFIGIKTREEVLKYLSFADMFVLPCIIACDGDRDGLPNVLLEAMMMGVPVITTNISAIPELIENMETGIIVPEKDEKALADAIIKLNYDRKLYDRVVDKGKTTIKKYFSIDICTEELKKIFLKHIKPITYEKNH